MTVHMCPRCGGPIPSEEHAGEYPGALSRVDNHTEICSQCGTDEAMIQYRNGYQSLTFTGWKNPPGSS